MDNATVITAIFSAVALVGAVIVAQMLAYRYSKKREIEEAHRNKRREVYSDIVAMIFKVIKHSKEFSATGGPSKLPEEVDAIWVEVTKGLLIWGSPEIIQEWKAFRRGTKTEPEKVMFFIENLLREIRDDLGNGNEGLARGDLVSLFMGDGENPLEK